MRQSMEYVLLSLSYVVLFVYIYFSVSKIDMVCSKWGLAFSSVFTVIASLFMAAGICLQFNLTPRLWSGELFPYIAMLVGLENSLCITASVVSIPVHYDVKSRLAHGLSKQGWSLTKNFLFQVLILFVGYLTLVPEIQEFCTFGIIGVVTDFYMQLFFYFPILTFDLMLLKIRLSKAPEERELQHLKQLTMSPVDLEPYGKGSCPVLRCFPSLVTLLNSFMSRETSPKPRLARFHSESALDSEDTFQEKKPSKFKKTHRKTASHAAAISLQMEKEKPVLRTLATPTRIKVLYWWTQNRLLTKFLMALFCLWAVWLAVIVHQLKQVNTAAQHGISETHAHLLKKLQSAGIDSVPPSAAVPQHLPPMPQDEEFVRLVSSWWPTLWELNGGRLPGNRLGFVPYATFTKTIAQSDVADLEHSEEALSKRTGKDPSLRSPTLIEDLGIVWLRSQFSLVQLVCWCVFAIVAGFLAYVLYETRATRTQKRQVDKFGVSGAYDDWSKETFVEPARKGSHRRIGSRTILEAVPIVFSGHQSPIECFCVNSPGDILVTSCLDNNLRIWDTRSGDCLMSYASSVEDSGFCFSEDQSGGLDSLGIRLRSLTADAKSFHEMFKNTAHMNNPPPVIWCLHIQDYMLAVGLSNGNIDFYKAKTARYVGAASNFGLEPNGGVARVKMQKGSVVSIKIKGKMDFMVLNWQPLSGTFACRHLKSVTAHQHSINALQCISNFAVTASEDRTLKVFDLESGTCLHTLYGHKGSVKQVVLDESNKGAYSCCSEGLICVWNLTNGTLTSTISVKELEGRNYHLLTLTSKYLVAQTGEGWLYIWERNKHVLEAKLKTASTTASDSNLGFPGARQMVAPVVINENLVVTSDSRLPKLYFWDIKCKILLREMELVRSYIQPSYLVAVDNSSVVCAAGNDAYRISVPIIHLP